MPRTNKNTVETTSGLIEVYSSTARALHWIVVLLIAIQIPIGLYMAYRGGELKIWDALTNNLYSSHKLIGTVILLLVVLRFVYRMIAGAPSPEPTLEPWQRTVSELTHWAIYALLFIVPIVGYVGVSMYPALNLFGAFNLPAVTAPNKAMAEELFEYHSLAAYLLTALVAMHVGAALHHYIFRKDNVLGRMLPHALRRE